MVYTFLVGKDFPQSKPVSSRRECGRFDRSYIFLGTVNYFFTMISLPCVFTLIGFTIQLMNML